MNEDFLEKTKEMQIILKKMKEMQCELGQMLNEMVKIKNELNLIKLKLVIDRVNAKSSLDE